MEALGLHATTNATALKETATDDSESRDLGYRSVPQDTYIADHFCLHCRAVLQIIWENCLLI